MADRPHLRLADHTDLANDDPFAELTRIMGFDPRQPARPSAAPEPVAAAPADDGFDEMDFSIDLEKELMGDFADAPAAPATSASSFDARPQDVEPTAQIPAPEAAAELEAGPSLQAEDDEISFDADWFDDDAVEATASGAGVPPQPDFGSYASVEALDRNDAATAGPLEPEATSALLQPANDVPPIEAVDPLADLDFHVEDLTDTTVPEEFVVDNHDIGDHTADLYAAAVPVEDAPSSDEVDIDDAFASALDDVDLSFDAAPTADAAEDEFDDLDRELNLSLRGNFEDTASPDDDADAAAVAQQPESEMSLEDELNALLGNALAGTSARSSVALASAPQARPLTYDTAVEHAAERAQADEHVPERGYEPVAFSPIDEQDERNERAAETSVFDWPEDAADPVPVSARFGQENLDPAEASAVENELDLEFDDQALEAAISHSMHVDAPTAEHIAEAPAAAEPLDAERDLPLDDRNPYAALAALSASLKPTRAWSRETPFVERREVAAAPVRYDDEPELAFEPEPAYAAQSAYEPDVALTRQPAYEANVAYASEPAYASQPAYQPQAAYEPNLAYEPEPAYEPQPAYEPGPIVIPEPVSAPVRHASGAPAYRDSHVPDIETYDVPEQAVALADDLDLPDFTYEDEPAPPPSYDDIDAEFTSLLNEMNASDHEQPAPTSGRGADSYHDEYRAPLSPRIDIPAVAGASYAASSQSAFAAVASPAPRQAMPSDPSMNPAQHLSATAPIDPADLRVDQELADMEFAYDPDLDEEMALPSHTPVPQQPSPRRGMMVAAVIGGVAILGGIGALALSFGGGGTDGPVLVRADDTPVKVKPENPGGTTIPNQDNKVYDSVAGGSAPAEPLQDTLVSTQEEPVEMPDPAAMDDMAAVEDGGADTTAMADAVAIPPSQKAEDRIEQSAADDAGVDNSVEVAAVAPRKVRTMIVKADGTLVAREEPAPAPAAETAAAGMTDPVPTAGPTTGTVAPAETDVASAPAVENTLPIATAPAEPAPGLAPVATAEPQPAEGLAPAATATGEESSQTPNSAPIAPTRPSDQPVDIVGEVKPERVAAATSVAAAPGAWAMQIASQPTEAAAQSSYQDLLRRYGGVLEGRQVNIVKAEISGKGTFWRVRVAAGSRNEAVSLCESYKSAGGNCFVSK